MGGGASQPEVEQLVLDAPKEDLCAAWQELPEEHQRLLRLALARAEKAEGGKVHSAFVFIKPHAVGVKVENLVREKLVAAGLTVRSEGDIEAKEIDEQRLIDQHYGAIAAKAVLLKPSELVVQEKAQKEFQELFGVSWPVALQENRVLNAMEASQRLGVGADEMGRKWDKLKKGESLLKFGGGFYCGQLEGLYVINGFYMNMRSKFTAQGQRIRFFEVQWPAARLSWAAFRGSLLGATDPATAALGSLRQEIYSRWQELGLKAQPDTGDNGVHGSASPFEALAERCNWLRAELGGDAFGRALLASGVEQKRCEAWFNDPQVRAPGGGTTSLFDLLEDLDGAACLERCVEILGANP